MSSWETLSVRYTDGKTESLTRFTSGDQPRTEDIFIGSKGPLFDGEELWIPHEVGDAYLLNISDTTDMGRLRSIFIDDQSWQVVRHKGSLWSVDIHYGPSYDYKEDVLASLPHWVKVGGNWSYGMD